MVVLWPSPGIQSLFFERMPFGKPFYQPGLLYAGTHTINLVVANGTADMLLFEVAGSYINDFEGIYTS